MRPPVTAKHVFPSVGLFEVRRVGGIVGLHIGTPQGEFIFHLRERSFVRHARGRCDDQGNPFRTLEQIDAEQAKTLGAAVPARTSVDEVRAPARPGRGSHLTAEQKAAYLAAYVAYHTTPGAQWKDVAAQRGVSSGAVQRWCSIHKLQCAEAIAAARTPILKPGGQLL